MAGQRRKIELSDPRALRALAHPTRLELVGLLRREGPLTATQAAEHVGESPSSCSFHLRQLAKWGLVEEAGGGKGRERPWRATALFTSWRPESEAGAELSRLVATGYLEQIEDWLAHEAEEPAEWRNLSGTGDSILFLTLDELRELAARLEELLAPYEERIGNPGLRPAGARRLVFIQALLPQPEEERKA
jgi:DNA-binding transcriptional ArsR family regulator